MRGHHPTAPPGTWSHLTFPHNPHLWGEEAHPVISSWSPWSLTIVGPHPCKPSPTTVVSSGKLMTALLGQVWGMKSLIQWQMVGEKPESYNLLTSLLGIVVFNTKLKSKKSSLMFKVGHCSMEGCLTLSKCCQGPDRIIWKFNNTVAVCCFIRYFFLQKVLWEHFTDNFNINILATCLVRSSTWSELWWALSLLNLTKLLLYF